MSITYFVDNVLGVDSNVGYDIDAPLRTVARALALCRSGYNDIIFILESGTTTSITESVVLSKDSVTLLGESTRISFTQPISVTANSVTVQSVRVEGVTGYGIDIDAVNNTHIGDRVILSGNTLGNIRDLGTGTYIAGSLDEIALIEQQLHDLWLLQGLDENNPMTVTPTSRTVAAITQVISGDGETTSTVTRT